MAKSVTVYTTQFCPYCSRAKSVLKQKSIAFKEVDLTNDPEQREKISSQTGWTTVPMIFIGEEFIGGCDDLVALDRQGKLEEKVRG
ncbi:MAG TPA: glutaredoxin 3 [Verrucomicrobiae bacterium]|nr:glutaredoxin 3 [Verrucomicrobiae bacterium]